MINFLSIKRGYCEQFAGTFAAMARSRWPADAGDGRIHPRRSSRRRPLPRRRPERPRVGRGVVRRLRLGSSSTRHRSRGAPGAEAHTGVAAAQAEGNGTPGTGTADNTPTPTSHAFDPTPTTGERGAHRPDDTSRPGVDEARATMVRAGGWIFCRDHSCARRLGHRHATGHQPMVTAHGQGPRRPGDRRLGRDCSIADDGRRAPYCRFDSARVCRDRSTSARPRRSRSPDW